VDTEGLVAQLASSGRSVGDAERIAREASATFEAMGQSAAGAGGALGDGDENGDTGEGPGLARSATRLKTVLQQAREEVRRLASHLAQLRAGRQAVQDARDDAAVLRARVDAIEGVINAEAERHRVVTQHEDAHV